MQRLKLRTQFQSVLNESPICRSQHFVLHVLFLSSLSLKTAETCLTDRNHLLSASQSCIGAVIPKRNARRATTRNAIKRQIFAAGEQFEENLPVAAYVVRLRLMFDREKFRSASSQMFKKTVQTEISYLFNQAISKSQGVKT